MIQVGFITTPLNGGHSARGVGFYTRHLLDHLHKYAAEFDMEIIHVSSASQINESFELVHYPFFDLFVHSLPFAKMVKTAVTIHDVIPLEFPEHYPPGIKGKVNHLLQKMSVRDADVIITDSYASVKSIKKHLHIPDSKIKLIYLAGSPVYNPVDSKKELDTVRKKYNLPHEFVLYVGDVNWNKNIPGLLRAAQSSRIPVVMVGKQISQLENLNLDHPELRHLKPILPILNSPAVIRPGFVSDEELKMIYNAATFYCQPSYAEGFGLPMLEAMMCKTPVACSRTHSLPEIGGSAVEYFDPGDENNMEEIFKKMISDPRHRKELGREGFKQSEKFTWEKTAKDTLRAYREIL